MNILLVYPAFPDTFWSFKHALKFISKKTAYPPLGLLTVAAMLPKKWNKKLVDMNVEKLSESQLYWADYVFISAISLHTDSVKTIIQRCKKAGKKTVAGGPLFTEWHEKYDDVDFLILNEAEVTLPLFLKDLEKGCPKHIYTSEEKPDIRITPVPLWNLIEKKHYSSMNVQYSRGCPFNCEFCDIVALYGRIPRLKSTVQVIDELQSLYAFGWRGSVFFVDDNFIGNKEKLKKEVLPAIIKWSEEKGHPFVFSTEVSINLSDDVELLNLMVQAGFKTVFIGIESPNEASLTECNKHQNINRDLMGSVDLIQNHGLQVQGGFIVGFDSDPDSIFDTLIRFIQDSKIVVAMVGLLNAPRGTRLFQRLSNEQRIISDMSGNNTDFSMNFKPKMEYNQLIEGYRRVITTIYSPKYYYERVMQFLAGNKALQNSGKNNITFNDFVAFLKSLFKIGILGKERKWYWKLLFHTLFTTPTQLPAAITFSIYGYHFRKIFGI